MEENKQHDLVPYSTWTWSVFPCATGRVAHWHYHSAILRSTASLRSSSPGYPTAPCSASSALDFKSYNPQSRYLSVTLAFLAGYFLILLKLVSIMHPGPWTRSSILLALHLHRCPHCPSAATPLPLIYMATLFSLLSSAALGLHTSYVQNPSILINHWEELRLPSSE